MSAEASSEAEIEEAEAKKLEQASEQDGVPPYVVASNRHLARFVRLSAATKTALQQVEGFGDEKARHYGEEILEVLRRFPTDGQAEPSEGGKS